MDNSYGDFRLPVTPGNKSIGIEARVFSWTRKPSPTARDASDGLAWSRKLHGYGPQFYVLGPIPDGVDAGALDGALAALKRVDPVQPVAVAGQVLHWRVYDFSWRYGKQGDLGRQGYHGLKRTMRWHEDPGVIPFDVYADEQAVELFRFQSAPGTTAIRLQACGEVQALLDGVPMRDAGTPRLAGGRQLSCYQHLERLHR